MSSLSSSLKLSLALSGSFSGSLPGSPWLSLNLSLALSLALPLSLAGSHPGCGMVACDFYQPTITICQKIKSCELISKLQHRIVVLANMPFDRLMSNERKWTKYRFYNICQCKNIVWLLIFPMLLWSAQWKELNNCQFTLFHWMIFQVYLPL